MAQGAPRNNAVRQPRGKLERTRGTIVIQVNPRIGDIVDSYLGHRNQDVESLLGALERGEFDRIRHMAHDLVGTGGSFGFDNMSLIGRSLESAALKEETEEIKQLVQDLADYLSNVKVVY